MTEAPATELGAIIEDCFGAARVAGIAERLDLGDGASRFEDLPKAVLLMLFASRSGSTYAGGLLANTPHFRRVAEAFNPGRLRKLRHDGQMADEAEAAQFLVRKWSTRRGFAAKCGVPGLIAAQLIGFLDAAWDRLSLIEIRRRDVVAQAVSLFRADLSGQFHSLQPVRREIEGGDYSREEITKRIRLIEEAYAMLARFANRSGKPVPTFWYEDICADPRGFVDEVCAFLQIEPPEELSTQVRVEPLRDGINEAWIERYRAGN